MEESQKVGRAVPSAPIELIKTRQFEPILSCHGALGTARPTLTGFWQQVLVTTTSELRGPERGWDSRSKLEKSSRG